MDTNILIADDDEGICNLLVEIAKDKGHNPRVVHDGNDFEKIYCDTLPGLIFLDLRLPGKDGIELIEYLGAKQSTTKLIILSGMDSRTLSSAEKLARHHNLEIAGILQKPVLLNTIEALLDNIELPENDKNISYPTITDGISYSTITDGINNEEFEVHYQPKIRIEDRLAPFVEGIEALARWNHPKWGWISPGEFIPVAESSGCIELLTEKIFTYVLEDMANWNDKGLNIKVSVNISPLLLEIDGLAERLEAMALSHNINPEQIVLEVTETAIMGDPIRSMSILTRMRLKGFGLSLDDFGTGFSSMAHLYRMPINEIKVDRMFASQALVDKEAMAIVRFLISLGKNLHLSVCIEGVEDKRLIEEISSAGSLTIQGYCFSKPMANDKVIPFCNQFDQENSTNVIQAQSEDHSEVKPVENSSNDNIEPVTEEADKENN